MLTPPPSTSRVLLHSCCAPCAGEVIRAIQSTGVDLKVFFYNPNIHPEKEYSLRKADSIRFCEAEGIEHEDGDYDVKKWYRLMKGLELEPEKGIRCSMCFLHRFLVTAQVARDQGYDTISTCLGLSRWKDWDQVTRAGQMAAKQYGLTYWDYNWRKDGGSDRMQQINRAYEFYQQEYCGCSYSLRDTNARRKRMGLPAISLGEHQYGVNPAE